MKNIIITGGELFNKGAMAMTFVAVSELKHRFPNHEIYLLSELDRQREENELNQYAFNFTGWFPIKFAKAEFNPFLKIACKLLNNKEYRQCHDLYTNCDLMIDISGYALSSSFSLKHVEGYLDHLRFARAFNIPVYLMPQSFGPFDFQEKNGNKMLERCKRELHFVRKIFVREKTGYDELCAWGLDNLELADDLVLCNKNVDLKKIFRIVPDFDIPNISKGSVAIIPNGMTYKVKDTSFIKKMYKEIIQLLIGYNKKVYIISHCTQDLNLCKMIKELFLFDEQVVLLSQDFSCIEYNTIVQSFEYVIASRYHSIIHAYKNYVPCIALGWAEKYENLLTKFEQKEYAFDLRQNITIDSILDKVSRMENNYSDESVTICKKIGIVQQVNVFDEIKL